MLDPAASNVEPLYALYF